MRALLAALELVVVGCLPTSSSATMPMRLPAQTELERAAAETTLAAWSAAGLPAPRSDCRPAELRLEEPTTHAEYAERCPWNGGETWECLRWRDMAPIAVMHPALPRERVGTHAQHALLHFLIRCTELTRSLDYYDGEHRDLRVWEQGGLGSVETRAERALESLLKGGSDGRRGEAPEGEALGGGR